LSYINFISPSEPRNQSDLPPAEQDAAKYAALLETLGDGYPKIFSVAYAEIIAVVFVFPAPTACAPQPAGVFTGAIIHEENEDQGFVVLAQEVGDASK